MQTLHRAVSVVRPMHADEPVDGDRALCVDVFEIAALAHASDADIVRRRLILALADDAMPADLILQRAGTTALLGIEIRGQVMPASIAPYRIAGPIRAHEREVDVARLNGVVVGVAAVNRLEPVAE